MYWYVWYDYCLYMFLDFVDFVFDCYYNVRRFVVVHIEREFLHAVISL